MKVLLASCITGVLTALAVQWSYDHDLMKATDKTEHWSKWGCLSQPYSDWNGALQFRTNLDTGLIEGRQISVSE